MGKSKTELSVDSALCTTENEEKGLSGRLEPEQNHLKLEHSDQNDSRKTDEYLLKESIDIINYLKSSRLFSHVSENFLQELVPLSKIETFESGVEILKENEINSRIYFIIQGGVSVYVGGTSILTLKRKGDIFGEMGVIHNRPCSTTVKTDLKTTLLSIRTREIPSGFELEHNMVRNTFYTMFAMVLTDKLNLTIDKAKAYEKTVVELQTLQDKYDRQSYELQQVRTDYKKSDHQQGKINGALVARSLASCALIHIKHEKPLVREICKIIVEKAGYPLALVGYKNQEDRAWEIKAISGVDYDGGKSQKSPPFETEILDHIENAIVPESSVSEVFSVKEDFSGEESLKDLKSDIILAIPIRVKKEMIGMLCICSDQFSAFQDENEKKLLEEMAWDLAYGIESIRTAVAQRKTKKVLQITESKVRALMSVIPDFTFQVNKLGVVTDLMIETSPAGMKSVKDGGGEELSVPGLKRSDITGKNLSDIYPVEIADYIKFHIDRALMDGKVHTIEYPLFYNNTIHFFEGRLVVSSLNSVLCVTRNITEQKKADEELYKLGFVIEQIKEGVMITDVKGIIQYVNHAFEQSSGYLKEELIGQKPKFLSVSAHNNYFYEDIWNRILAGNIWKGKMTNCRKDGSVYDEEVAIFPIRDVYGELINFVAVRRDISREAGLEKQLRQSQKMEAIGTLAGGIAHDFNNILQTILGFSDLLLKKENMDEQSRKWVEYIQVAGSRAKDLVRQILTFCHKDDQKLKPVFIPTLLKETLKFLRSTLPTNVEIRSNLRVENCAILADYTQIHQVLLNICTNAGYAMRDSGGVMDIELIAEYLNETFCQKHKIEPGMYLKLSIKDTGMGIPKKFQSRIFDPFFTTKPVGEGTGIGLAVVKSIVQRYSGCIEFSTEEGKGTVFDLYFPVMKEKAKVSDGEQKIMVGGTESILLVDDDQLLVELQTECLRQLGYRVQSTTSSQTALDLIQTEPESIDLIVTDQTMPFMTGDRLVREVLKIRPDLPIIMVTGYSHLMNDAKAEEIGVKYLFRKPLDLHKLAVSIRKLLD